MVSGKQLLFLSSKKLEGLNSKDGQATYELLLPIEVYWDVQKLIKDVDYMMASFEDAVAIHDLHTKVLRRVVNYVVHEKDRIQLKETIDGTASK